VQNILPVMMLQHADCRLLILKQVRFAHHFKNYFRFAPRAIVHKARVAIASPVRALRNIITMHFGINLKKVLQRSLFTPPKICDNIGVSSIKKG
jgi:hypothetical protein